MNARSVSGLRLFVVGVLLLGLNAVAAVAQVQTVTNSKFKCPAKNQKPFCLKNNSGGKIIIMGLTVYRGTNQQGDHHRVLDDRTGEGGDDLTLAKGKIACWCVSFKPKSFDVTVFSYTVMTSYAGGLNRVLVDDLAAMGDIPLFEGGVVTLSLSGVGEFPLADDVGEIWVADGKAAEFPGVSFMTEKGDLFNGSLSYSGSSHGETSEEAILLEEQ